MQQEKVTGEVSGKACGRKAWWEKQMGVCSVVWWCVQ